MRSPGFPVEVGGFLELHAPFLTERRTRCRVRCCVTGNPGRDDKGEGDASMENGAGQKPFSSPLGGPQANNQLRTALVRRKAVLLCRLKLVIHHSGD